MLRIGRFAGTWLLAGALGAGAALAATETVLHNFAPPPKGANPESGVIGDSAGNLYGTTYSGGAHNMGVVYQIDSSGRETVLYNFTGGADGGQPTGSLIRDSSKNLYGTTYLGGTGNVGVVYMVSAAGQETVLYTFTGGADGKYPSGGVIRDSAGNLYGTAGSGGAGNAGVVYRIDTAGHETVLHSFTGVDGMSPQGVIRDSAGNLFGTTSIGGKRKAGVAYKLDTSGNLKLLYQFTDRADGGYPAAGVVRDSLGNIYGTTAGGGTGKVGVVYMVDTGGNETVLHAFNW